MTDLIERRRRQLDLRTIVGLLALAVGALSEAVRVVALDRSWIADAGAFDRTLQVVWIVGLVVFGVAFAALWWLGRRLGPPERRALADELQLHLSRRTAIAAFAVTYVAAVLLATVPAAALLPGRAVALTVVAVATGALAAGRIGTAGS